MRVTRELWRCSDVLLIRLGRVVQNQTADKQVKIERELNIPTKRLVVRCCEGGTGPPREVAYELYGIIAHQGKPGQAGSGHYVAHVNIEGMWHTLDDAAVRQQTALKWYRDRFFSRGAYGLFYRRCQIGEHFGRQCVLQTRRDALF